MLPIQKRNMIHFFCMVFIALGILCPRTASSDVCSDGVAFPPFVAKGLDANLLMIIDNSASMYDLAYVPDTAAEQGYCFDDSYDSSKSYTGYFDSDNTSWYIYNLITQQFEKTNETNAQNECANATGTQYSAQDGCITIDETKSPKEVTAIAAKGNFFNWAAASKFDVEKKVLTGGKYDSGQQQMVMESRGCMDMTFVKKVAITKVSDSSTHYVTLGIISAADATSDHLTYIEIYDVTTTGFQNANCKIAIDAFSSADPNNLGDVKNYTTGCLDPVNTGLMDSQTAFLHIMQECWYFNAHGAWQPGAGTLGSLKLDCQNVYNLQGNTPQAPQPDEATYLAQYAPETQSPSDVCYGKYGTSEGFVGRCWEAFYETSYNCVDRACNPATDTPTGVSTSATQAAAEVCATDINKWIYCNGNYSSANNKCVGTPGTWDIRQDCVGAGAIKEIYWTDDNNGTFIESGLFIDADDCVDQSLQKWCGNVDDPGVVDPTDAMSSTGTTYNVPALLVDSAVDSQLGAPLLTMKGLIEKGSPPIGLLHEYQGQIRMGAMAFNEGPVSECAPVEQPPGSGRYVANLYDCLQDKGSDINVSSTADTTKRDGAHIISYIGKGVSHTDQLVDAINDIEATTWTPTAEAYYNALGYYSQDTNKRLAPDDFLVNSDYGGALPSNIFPKADPANPNTIPLWTRNTVYPASDWTTDPATVTIVRDASDNLYWTDDGGTSSEYQADGVTLATEIGHDTDVVWMPFDPVQNHCQKNNILILTDGASTADQDSDIVTLAAGILDGNEAGADSPYACGSLTGSTLLDDLAYYGFTGAIYPTSKFIDENGNPLDGDNIRTYLVSTGILRDVSIYEIDPNTGLPMTDPITGATLPPKIPEECDSETLLNHAAANGYDLDPVSGNPLGALFKAENPSDLGYKLRAVFNDIRAGRASGSAASVISSSRSGEGAIYQALFFTSHTDSAMREINWAGDIHSLWLDRYGNIREDCGAPDCNGGDPCADPVGCPADQILNLETDNIVSFYTDATAGGMALARRYSDGAYGGQSCSDNSYYTQADCLNAGETWDYSFNDGQFEAMGCSVSGPASKAACIAAGGTWDEDSSVCTFTNEGSCIAAGGAWDYSHSPNFIAEDVELQDIKYIWSGGEWLADAAHTQKGNFTDTTQERYIFTHDGSGDPYPFTTTGLWTASGFDANILNSHLQASDVTEAFEIINYIRGLDQAGYRSRLIDWDENGTPEYYKLGDVVHSTPTIVSRPAEDYDVIYRDESYRLFRKQYENRRTMIYAGGNDGGLHAFNGGYFDRKNNQFHPAQPIDGTNPVQYQTTEYELGAEVWMFIPYNLQPHLKCLTDKNYDIGSHKYYVDLKPKIFDAKIFDPNDGIHTGGWGTILVGGMRLGGGDVGVDTDGDSVDDQTLRSAYFILDITNPECPPVILAEFTHADLGFTTSYPTAIPMLLSSQVVCSDPSYTTRSECIGAGETWSQERHMNWYLAFGSGPHDAASTPTALEGRSDQKAKLFVLKLGGTDDGSDANVLDYVYKSIPSGSCLGSFYDWNRPALVTVPTCSDPAYSVEADCIANGHTWADLQKIWEISPMCSDPTRTQANCTSPHDWEEFPKSFFGDLITVDYDLSFQADALYFGSTADTDQDLGDHTGGMHRFVINDVDDPATWDFSTMLNLGQPISAAPAVAFDGLDYWVYFGTGRFFTKSDKTTVAQQSFYGVKERDRSGAFDLTAPSDGDLVNVSQVFVFDGGELSSVPFTTGGRITTPTQTGSSTLSSVDTFKKLKNAMSSFDGWKIDFDMSGERNLGQAAVLGDIVTFTTYVPSTDPCTAEGESYLWAPYYKTGTAYLRSVIGLHKEFEPGKDKVLRKLSLGSGLSTTPNIHSGVGEGTKAFVQTSTGAIIGIEQANPGVTRSGPASWRELSDN